MPRRAYSYKRLSSRKQALGDGVRRQGEYAPYLCDREGWFLDESFDLEDIGKSAYRSSNADIGALGMFLDAVRSGRVSPGSVLIIESLDRLSRDFVDEAYDLFRGLIKSGIWIATRTPERIYSKEASKNFLDLLEPLFIFLRAHEESEIKSFRAKKNWAKKKADAREKGTPLSRMCPAWMTLTEDGYRLKEDAARTIRHIVQWCLDGFGGERITERLRRDPDRFPPLTPHGWSRTSVNMMLSDHRLYGAHQPVIVQDGERKKRKGRRIYKIADGDMILDFYPAVISREEWDRLQRVRCTRSRSTGRPGKEETNLFTGLIRRAGSGVRLHTKPGGGGRTYLREPEPAHDPARIPYDSVEECILSCLTDLELDDVRPDVLVSEQSKSIAKMTQQVIAIKDRMEVIQAQLADPGTEPAGASALAAVLTMLASTHATAVKDLQQLKDSVASGSDEELGEFKGLLHLLADAGDADRQELRLRVKSRIRALVETVSIYCEKIRKGSRLLHIQIDLRAGGRRYVQLLQSKTVGERDYPGLDLSGVDLRTYRGPTETE